jgi:hypothetical protein
LKLLSENKKEVFLIKYGTISELVARLLATYLGESRYCLSTSASRRQIFTIQSEEEFQVIHQSIILVIGG